jgi:hypothetical protein
VPDDDGALDVAWLARHAADGDRWAWGRLVDQYAWLIWAMTNEFKRGESDAADVAQVTWRRLLEHIDPVLAAGRAGEALTSARAVVLENFLPPPSRW